MKATENFVWQEFTHPYVWKLYKQGKVDPRWFIDPKIPYIAQALKMSLKAEYCDDAVKNVVVVINNWHTGGARKESGFRIPTKTGAYLSQHKQGRAFDCKVYIIFKDGERKELGPAAVKAHIINNQDMFMALGLTTIESAKIAKTWTHVDCRWTGKDYIWICGG